MTPDAKLALMAKAILELSRKAATTRDYDGEEMVSNGIDLQDETALQEIADYKGRSE